MNTKLFFGILTLVLLIYACEKEPGIGGTSTIRGRVIVHEYNKNFTILRDSFPGAKEDVYIIYGDDAVYGDRFEANFDGTYEFNYLREGHYTVFAYSKDSTLDYDLTSQEKAIKEEVEITGKNQVVEVPDIIILK